MAKGFLSLPAELRNMIYDHAVATPHQAWTDLRCAHPPVPTLLLINQQIYQETKILYQVACRKYWSSTYFFLDTAAVNDTDMARLNNLDFDTICHLKLGCRATRSMDIEITWDLVMESSLVDPRGAWLEIFYNPLEDYRAATPFYRVFMHKPGRVTGADRLPGSRFTGLVHNGQKDALETCAEQVRPCSMYEQIEEVMAQQIKYCKRFGLETLPYVPSELLM